MRQTLGRRKIVSSLNMKLYRGDVVLGEGGERIPATVMVRSHLDAV